MESRSVRAGGKAAHSVCDSHSYITYLMLTLQMALGRFPYLSVSSQSHLNGGCVVNDCFFFLSPTISSIMCPPLVN